MDDDDDDDDDDDEDDDDGDDDVVVVDDDDVVVFVGVVVAVAVGFVTTAIDSQSLFQYQPSLIVLLAYGHKQASRLIPSASAGSNAKCNCWPSLRWSGTHHTRTLRSSSSPAPTQVLQSHT